MMVPKTLVNALGPTVAKIVFWIGVALLVIAILAIGKCSYDRTAKTRVELSEGQAGAARDSGKDAVETVGQQAGRENDADRITEENENEIRNAEGASDPVAPGVRDAGLGSLCRRAAYRDDPRCLQRAAPE